MVDEFQALGRPKVDILFVVDDSPNMAAVQDTLADDLEVLVNEWMDLGIDFEIGVTTTDMTAGGAAGRLLPIDAPIVVTPDTPNAPVELIRLASAGWSGSTDTEGLAAARAALSGAQGVRFVRADAGLSVVVLSAGDDASEGTVLSHVQDLLLIKGPRNTNLFSVTAVVGGEEGCSGPAGEVAPSPRYVEAVERTGGALASICDAEWSRDLLGSRVEIPSSSGRFYLTHQPVQETIVVFVDEARVEPVDASGAEAWRYQYDTNEITFFEAHAPAPGAMIRVEYEPELL